jgi:hypothetical protein
VLPLGEATARLAAFAFLAGCGSNPEEEPQAAPGAVEGFIAQQDRKDAAAVVATERDALAREAVQAKADARDKAARTGSAPRN